MTGASSIVVQGDAAHPSAVLSRSEQYGFHVLDLVHPPRRFWSDGASAPQAVEMAVDARRAREMPTPAWLLAGLPDGENWLPHSRRSVSRLRAYYLIAEDPQRRLDARPVNTLAHQVSLVRHILDDPRLGRVLIADEVGLGKTVEAGLLVTEWLAQRPGLRVLYLAPARLVDNVRREFDGLGLGFRQWSAADSDARIEADPRIIASLHRAVHPSHLAKFTGSRPWDVLIVDECHHLTDWAEGGGDPVEKYKLVRSLIDAQPPDGRVVFLSGTPHQGHAARFENLLRLLRAEGEDDEALRGRVIYRTKDDVRDWADRPLFPRRQVNEPFLIELDSTYRAWMTQIHGYFRPPGGGTQQAGRAAGWRWAQALQWAASSPQAGLGYLARQAIRQGWEPGAPALAAAVAALRPYRSGPSDEPLESLHRRMKAEVERRGAASDLEDIEEDDAATVDHGSDALESLLADGARLVREIGDEKWRRIDEHVLRPAGDEKVVLFAQPIETVTALAGYLARTRGVRPATILGGQSDAERRREVERFWAPDGPRYLVSSRAGGEGINLQVASRLVHVDVPWNPMEMEQRVGRVHRFGSRRTIVVDTVVVKDSREAQAYRVARERLRGIASTVVGPERFEGFFARVMSLVRVEDLQEVYEGGPLAPLDGTAEDKIGKMVRAGFQTWNEFDREFAVRQREIRHLDPGLATWDDLGRFLREHAKAEPLEGYSALRFTCAGDEVDPTDERVEALRLSDGRAYACGDHSGSPVVGPGASRPAQLGLNLPLVSEALRRAAFTVGSAGAALLRWPAQPVPGRIPEGAAFGVLVLLVQSVRTDPRAGWSEIGLRLRCYVVPGGAEPTELSGEEKGSLLRGIFNSSARTRSRPAPDLEGNLAHLEGKLVGELSRPSEVEMSTGVRHAVIPLFAAIVQTA